MCMYIYIYTRTTRALRARLGSSRLRKRYSQARGRLRCVSPNILTPEHPRTLTRTPEP